MPIAIRSLPLDNAVPDDTVPELLRRMLDLVPRRLTAHAPDL